MKKSLFCLALITILASIPRIPLAAEPPLIAQSQIDKAIAQYAPKSKPCALWDQEHLGLRCISINRPGAIHGVAMRYLAVTAQNNGLIVIQDGEQISITPPAP